MALVRRTRILLSVLQELGGDLANRRMQNLLFLYCKENVKRDDYYEFIQFIEGPCSIQAEEDKAFLIRKKVLESSDRWVLASTSFRYAIDLDFFEKIAIQELKNKWTLKSDDDIEQFIAAHYPILRSGTSTPGLYTIGYEGLSPEAYINALLQRGIKLLVDVRKNAFSQKFGFSKSELTRILNRSGIEYRHIPELGIDSDKRHALVLQSDYDSLFKTYVRDTLPKQTESLDHLFNLVVEQQRVAITCFEADPDHCHRSHVAHALKSRADFPYRIEHLMPCNHLKRQKLNTRRY